ncbi:hypothetical protein GCM10017608_25200 [Agromyces luteolus]|uniref:DUF937 domain-containing protein n=1 Tax=Agromyces luteolus TaxID=88373 RepID=A0A7C9HR05_9MICO|nr:DUF937 domain-containing protein [Agromyces luteolus]MUN07329.1 DUF937 domain-containing protein [Agromyces luteolus]GLK28586.1 hypothetical protein GCM10017608_25200 [Agromyces luteolus]
MASYDDIIANIPIADLASRLGVDEATARAAVDQALPALLGGMGANAQDAAGAASLERAVQHHPPQLFEGGVDLDEVDEDDGDKIVHNVFGANTDQVVQKLGSAEGKAEPGLIQKLLPILAPIVLSFLAGQFAKRQQGSSSDASTGGGGGIGDLLGGLLGGAAGGGASGGSAGGLGGLGGLGDLLGGLLGGGKR